MEFIFVKKGDNMKIAIVGAGKLGFKVTEALLGGDHSVTVIDTNENALNKLKTPTAKKFECSKVSVSALMIFSSPAQTATSRIS